MGVPYGVRDGEKFDVFGAESLPKGIQINYACHKSYYTKLYLDAPVFVYIHGGYWQALDRSISSYSVAPLHKAGNVVVIVGYELAPKGLLLRCLNILVQINHVIICPYLFKVEVEDIVLEIQAAISAILKWAAERGSR